MYFLVALEMAAKQMAEHLKEIKKAADTIKKASALIVIAGTGMGVDSGLPDFRGPQGSGRRIHL